MNEDQYLTFQLKGKGYGLPIHVVREIIGYETPDIVPMMPEWMKGIINLRGHGVPVIDLAIRFYNSETTITNHSCIVIFNAGTAEDEKLMGLIVDSVSEVILFSNEMIEAPPETGTGQKADFLVGVGKLENKFYLLLNIRTTLEYVSKMDLSETLESIEEMSAK
ncbi:MAG: purine-binding chemotaxis protein CheW [Leptospiraceae bacterium]|nr:purine-binding chemotaxis protein CheW [Leptospiraceae bacterium]MCB1199052.1 purine-binding chemotaxis protein CheW [Leptospiraceae bacterium]